MQIGLGRWEEDGKEGDDGVVCVRTSRWGEMVGELDEWHSQCTHEILDSLYVCLPVDCAFVDVDLDWGCTRIRVIVEHEAEQDDVRDQKGHSRKIAWTV